MGAYGIIAQLPISAQGLPAISVEGLSAVSVEGLPAVSLEGYFR